MSSVWEDRFFLLVNVVTFGSLFITTAFSMSDVRSDLLQKKIALPGIQPGWFLGLPQDLSDAQWRSLRNFFPLLLLAMSAHTFLSWISFQLEKVNGFSTIGPRKVYYVVSNLGFVLFLHGSDSLWVLSIGITSYFIGKMFGGSRLNVLFTWVICLSTRFLSEYYNGFRDVGLAAFLWRSAGFAEYQGVYYWRVQFNLTILRLISFNVDLFRKHKQKLEMEALPGSNKHSDTSITNGTVPAERSIRKDGDSVDVRSEPEYNLLDFLSYVYYIPLYIAGPISSFDSWHAQAFAPGKVVPVRQIIWMLIRTFIYILAIEIGLHIWYYVTINNNREWDALLHVRSTHSDPARQGAFEGIGWEVAWGGFFTLQFMYLKFLSIWRFFRAWSLLDGIDVPENMNRCVNNNFSFAGFWRQWHSSLNKWIVSYVYVPLGGRQTQMWNMWVIFTFIGLWHDLEWKWMAWAWLNCLFFSLELAAVAAVQSGPLAWVRSQAWWRFAAAAAGAANIYLLILANLAIMHGFQGSADFLRAILLGPDGRPGAGTWRFCVLSFAFFFCLQMLQQSLRRAEAGAPAAARKRF